MRNGLCSLRALCRLVYFHEKLDCPQSDDNLFNLVQNIVSVSERGGHVIQACSNFTIHQFHIIRFYVAEFVVTYEKSEEDQISPTTLKNYTLGLQWAFKEFWEYDLKLFSRSVFGRPRERVFAVVDNRARSLQREGHHSVSKRLLGRWYHQFLPFIVFVQRHSSWISHPTHIFCWDKQCHETYLQSETIQEKENLSKICLDDHKCRRKLCGCIENKLRWVENHVTVSSMCGRRVSWTVW